MKKKLNFHEVSSKDPVVKTEITEDNLFTQLVFLDKLVTRKLAKKQLSKALAAKKQIREILQTKNYETPSLLLLRLHAYCGKEIDSNGLRRIDTIGVSRLTTCEEYRTHSKKISCPIYPSIYSLVNLALAQRANNWDVYNNYELSRIEKILISTKRLGVVDQLLKIIEKIKEPGKNRLISRRIIIKIFS